MQNPADFLTDEERQHLFTDPVGRAALEKILRASKHAEGFTASLIGQLGAHGPGLYARAPQWHKRTVQRINKAVAMYLFGLGVEFQKHSIQQEHCDSLVQNPDAMFSLLEAANKARVSVKTALESFTLYLNPLERVTGTLERLRILAEHQKLSNPTGLFVKLMRSGDDVRLPAHLETRQQPVEAPKRSVRGFRVGDAVQGLQTGARFIVKAFSETGLVLARDGDDLADLIRASFDQVRHCSA
jgi:hypothetical protein